MRQRQEQLLVRGQPGLQREFLDSQNYTEKPYLKSNKQKTPNKTMESLNFKNNSQYYPNFMKYISIMLSPGPYFKPRN